jgi:leucyl/phenylalanyl-tRNA---protein transferase
MPIDKLTPDILEMAYRNGIFPMGDPETGGIAWYQPEPRTIIDLEHFHVSRRLAKTMRSGRFDFTINREFESVMRHCSRASENPEEVWISPAIIDLYVQMHRQGKAHSVEVWREGELVGGLYGVALGGAFMGESMFHIERDASKAALVYLVQHLKERRFTLLDTQFPTEHLAQFGILMIPHREYIKRLKAALEMECRFD